ncbi:MAG: DUF4405 domain-containing protein [Acetobacteraceae bacterium]|nr:DUF4405 domain-containing protein [Acetobacteraceae bacterium]
MPVLEKTARPIAEHNNLLAALINRFATPLTAGLFAVSAVSGVALFFHWMPGAFPTMHIWLSVVLLAPFAFHVWKNWRPLLGYAKRGTLFMPFAACVVVPIPFTYSGVAGSDRGNPGRRTTELMTHATLSELAPVLRTTPDSLLMTLRQRGFQAQSSSETLEAVAVAAGKEPTEVLSAVMPAR